MHIVDLSHPQNVSVCCTASRRGATGESVVLLDEVQVEHELKVYVNDVLAARMVCTPGYLIELVLGRLLSDGVIASSADVECVQLNAASTEVYVELCGRMEALQDVEPCLVTTYGSKGLLTRIDSGVEEQPGAVNPVPWTLDEAFELAIRFADDTPMHRTTFGAHSCYLARGGEVLYCCEDLGRHNALDKVLGCALRDDVDLSQATVFTSGRIPADMASKAIRAGIPILISKAVPTQTAIDLAKRANLTLIGSARPDALKVFNDPLNCADWSAAHISKAS